jgi:hypothetical protein
MMPSIPASAAYKIGKQLEGYCTNQKELTLPIIKISKDLYSDWENSNDPNIHHCSEEIAKRGWNDTQGNLTSYRNLSNKKNGLLIVLLIGVDRVTDASSLLDFHHCDFNTIWEDLDKNFSSWIKQLFDRSFIGFEEETVLIFFKLAHYWKNLVLVRHRMEGMPSKYYYKISIDLDFLCLLDTNLQTKGHLAPILMMQSLFSLITRF